MTLPDYPTQLPEIDVPEETAYAVPDGWTWTDSTGRPWTVHGDGVTLWVPSLPGTFAVEQVGDRSTEGEFAKLTWTLDTPEPILIDRTSPLDAAGKVAIIDRDVGEWFDPLPDTIEVGDTVAWSLIGTESKGVVIVGFEYAAPPTGLPSDVRRYEAALLIAAKLWERRNSPIGIAGGFETGPTYVARFDPDVDRLLVGLRIAGDISLQQWPTPAALRQQSGIAGSATNEELQAKIDAAVAVVTQVCTGAAGGKGFA